MCKADILISSDWMLTFENISKLALELGFDACGVAPVHYLDEDAQFMDSWIAQGLHGEMDYLERNRDKRYDPAVLVPGAQAVVVCLLTYEHSGRDYHRRVKSLLYALEAKLKETFGEDIVSATHQHIFCDSAPMLERRWCVEAGLGFIGKNHQLIHPTLGSMVHPGEIVINQLPIANHQSPISNCQYPISNRQYPIANRQYPIANIQPPIAPTCSNCRLCLDACPTGALRNEVWDARQCIAYTTHHCLECQHVCPYNQTTPN